MKLNCLILIVTAALPLAGCSTHRGGTGQAPVEYNTGGDLGESYPTPRASPTFRPGLNPQDPRDAHFATRPEESSSPMPR